jgi:hypothetical protein
MTVENVSSTTAPTRRPLRRTFRPGDLVISRSGYPTLFEVVNTQEDGLLRVHGLNWAPGYSALVDADDVRPVNSLLAERT